LFNFTSLFNFSLIDRFDKEYLFSKDIRYSLLSVMHLKVLIARNMLYIRILLNNKVIWTITDIGNIDV